MTGQGVPLRLGLIGAGRWGRVLIATIRRRPDLDLAWLASTATDAASLVRDGATVTADWHTFTGARLDGLVIATPPDRHGEPLLAAIAAGLPVFVEKPMVTTAVEAGAVAAAAHDAVVVVDHTALFHPGYAAIRALLATDTPRRIVSVGGQWGRRGGDIGALWDYGPHDLALCLDLIGLDARLIDAERVRSERIDGARCEVIRLHLEAPGGTAEVTFGNAMEPKRRWLGVDDGRAAYLLDALASEPLSRAPAGTPLVPGAAGDSIPVPDALPLDLAFARFAAAIRGDRAAWPPADARLGLAVVRLLLQAEAALPPL
jgi:predicted dehydrogenase